MTGKKIKVGIVAPVHNRRSITVRCLKSLSRIAGDDLEVRTIIVDDGSTDGTSETVEREFPNVEIIKADGNLWFTEGTNVGIRAALKHDPDYVLTINDDEVFDADFLKYMVETAEKNPKSIVGSLLLLWDTPHKLFQIAPVFDVWSGGWRHWHQQTVWTIPKSAWEVELIVGNCVLFPAQVFSAHGLMDSTRYPNFGDAEFTPRLKKKGWKLLIDPRARVFCQPNNVPASISNMNRRQKFNALFVNLGHIHNLRRRFYANLDGAPNFLQGVISYVLFLVRVALKKNVEKSDWSNFRQEKPLSEIFAASVVNE